MMNAVKTPRLGCEFDRFLYASVGEDHNGMPLTVLSALARNDVDAWEEASKLTRLPKGSAVTLLASRLGALRNVAAMAQDPVDIAAPLIALLPCASDRPSPMLKFLKLAAPTTHPQVVSSLLTVFAYFIFMLLGQWLMGSLQTPRQLQTPPTSAHTIELPSATPSIVRPQSTAR